MVKYTAVLEQADDGSWSAYTLSPSLVIGVGSSREEAIEDLRTAMSFWLNHMKESGQQVPHGSMELITFEVAA